MQRRHLSLIVVQGLKSLPRRPDRVIMAFKEKLSFLEHPRQGVRPLSPVEVIVDAKQPSGWERSPESEGKSLQSSSGSGRQGYTVLSVTFIPEFFH